MSTWNSVFVPRAFRIILPSGNIKDRAITRRHKRALKTRMVGKSDAQCVRQQNLTLKIMRYIKKNISIKNSRVRCEQTEKGKKADLQTQQWTLLNTGADGRQSETKTEKLRKRIHCTKTRNSIRKCVYSITIKVRKMGKHQSLICAQKCTKDSSVTPS